MPVYEYKCQDCDTKFEFFARSMSQEASSCPECGGSKLKKLLSAFGFKSGSTSGGDFRSSAGGSACSSCSSSSCATCHH